MLNELEIEAVIGREIPDSEGNPTVEVEVCLMGGTTGRATVPSGASTEKFEAVELRDDGKRYSGQGVEKAVGHVNLVLSEVVLFESTLDQRKLDQVLLNTDGTEDKGELGANAILDASMAMARATANGPHVLLYRYLGGIHVSQLPIPMVNILNGGKHADNTVDLQEFMIMPCGACCLSERLRMCTEIYHTLKKLLKEDGYSTGVGDEGGFTPGLKNSEEVLEYPVKTMEKSGLKPGTDMKITIDTASSELYDKASGIYLFPGESRVVGRQIRHSTSEMVEYYKSLMERFPVCSVKDGLKEEGQEGWKMLTRELGNRTQLVGDDLLVTSTERLAKGIGMEAENTILVKVNRIGTLTESFEAIEMAERAGFGAIISHCSGETEDPIIADIAVAANAGQIETGAPYRSDRTAKCNQLLHIEENLTLEV